MRVCVCMDQWLSNDQSLSHSFSLSLSLYIYIYIRARVGGIKENKKIAKYFDLAREQKKLRNMKVAEIPIVIGDFGMVSEGLEKRLAELEIRERIGTIQTKSLLISAKRLKKSSGDPWRLIFNQTSVKDQQLNLV